MSKQTMILTPTGVGRKDYSEDIQYSVEQQIRSLQQRFFYSVKYINLTGLVYPNVYEAPLSFLVDSILQNTAPKKPYLFYLVEVSSERNALVVVAFNRYASYADYLAGIVAEHLGTVFGYGVAKLSLTKGLPTLEGSVYTVQFAELCGLNFNMDVTLHGLIGGPEEVE